jgi:epoxyqueuosine reductase QueG
MALQNTNVINAKWGAVFLANVITNYDFEYNEPITDFCGHVLLA